MDNYKEKLSLQNKDDGLNPMNNDFAITIDFQELCYLKQATEEAGFDPYC